MAEEKKNIKLNTKKETSVVSEIPVDTIRREYHDQSAQDIAAVKLIKTAEALVVENCDTERFEKKARRMLANIFAVYLETNNYDELRNAILEFVQEEV